MPHSVAKFRQSIRRSSRTTSFHRQHPSDRSPFDAPDRPPPANDRSFLRPTRSFPNLARFVDRKPDASQTSHNPQTPHPPSLPKDPVLVEVAPPPSLSCPNSPTPQAQSAQPLSTSTISTNSSLSAANHPIPPPVDPTPKQMTPIPEQTLPHRNKSLLQRVSSSQRIRRLSLSHRSRSRTRSNSFSETPSPWTSSTPSYLSQRSDTDDSLSWSRFFSLSSSDLREHRIWKKRHSSYSCSDFEIAEEDSIVEIGIRLPDRADGIAEEDIFGRRRGDFVLKNGESLAQASGRPVLACDVSEPRPAVHDFGDDIRPKPTVKSSTRKAAGRGRADNGVATVVPNEEERTIENISRAMDSSRGRLRRSANMSRAFRAVITSGEGFVRKSELVQATLNSEESKDPSVIILLHPESCEPGNSQIEDISRTSEESGSSEGISKANGMGQASVGFSTSMTAKQCAATLETILRDMSCKVSRYTEDGYGSQKAIRLKASRLPDGARLVERKMRIMVTIREEDEIRTSVAFRRIAGLYSSRNSHVPLCSEIRDRFQREWPAIVEALYIRLPNVQKRHHSSL